MLKKISFVLLIIIGILNLSACGNDDSNTDNSKEVEQTEKQKEENKEVEQIVEKPKAEKELEKIVPEELNYTIKTDEELITVARGLIEKFDSLSVAQTKEEYDKIRKDLYVSYDFYAPLDEWKDRDKAVKTVPSNEKLIKAESYFIYEFDFKTDRTLMDGTKAPVEKGHVTFEIIEDDYYGNYKITVIR